MASNYGVSLPIRESLEDQLSNWGLSISRRVTKKGAVSFACLPDLYKVLFESPSVKESTERRLKPGSIHTFNRRRTISSKRDIEEVSMLVLKPNDGSRSPVFRAEKSGKKNEVIEITFKGVEDVYECMRYWDIPFITCNKLFGALLGHDRGALALRFLPGERVKKNTKKEKIDEDLEGKHVENSLRESSSCPAKIDVEEEQSEFGKEENIAKIAPEQIILETRIVAKHIIDNSAGKKYTLELIGKTNFKEDFELDASLSETQKEYSISINDFNTIYNCMLVCMNNSNAFFCEREAVLDSNILHFQYFPKSRFAELWKGFGFQARIVDLTARYSITVSNKNNFVTYKLYVTGKSFGEENKFFSFKATIGSDPETNKRENTIFKTGLYTKEELSNKDDEKLLKNRRSIAQERRSPIAK